MLLWLQATDINKVERFKIDWNWERKMSSNSGTSHRLRLLWLCLNRSSFTYYTLWMSIKQRSLIGAQSEPVQKYWVLNKRVDLHLQVLFANANWKFLKVSLQLYLLEANSSFQCWYCFRHCENNCASTCLVKSMCRLETFFKKIIIFIVIMIFFYFVPFYFETLEPKLWCRDWHLTIPGNFRG